jgi:hypothetical protein
MGKYKIKNALQGKSSNAIMTEQAYREKSSRYLRWFVPIVRNVVPTSSPTNASQLSIFG